jgi:hypothetical protein
MDQLFFVVHTHWDREWYQPFPLAFLVELGAAAMVASTNRVLQTYCCAADRLHPGR